jgi:dephospho-CoA kinase
MARRREHLSAYLRICVSGRQQNHKKIEKIQERIIRYRLKKNVPAGSNAYLRICIFSKEITALYRWKAEDLSFLYVLLVCGAKLASC